MSSAELSTKLDELLRGCSLELKPAVDLPWDWPDPLAVVEPATMESVAELTKGCGRHGIALVPSGGGTDLTTGAPPSKPYVLVRTTAMNRILQYEPDEMVVVCQAGVTLNQLQQLLRAHHQRLALRLPFETISTMGGIVSTNRAGVLRATYGAPRDLLIGVNAVMSGGRMVKGGGTVVKNVAGYDLCKLFAGSYGSLGMITSVNFKTTVVTDEDVTVIWRAPSFSAAMDAGFHLHQARLFAAGLCVLSDLEGGGPVIAAYLQGVSERVNWQRKSMSEILLTLGFEPGTEATVTQTSAILASISPFKQSNLLWLAHCSILPTEVPTFGNQITGDCGASRITVLPGTGELFVTVPKGTEYWPWQLQEALPPEGNVRFTFVSPEVLDRGQVERWGRRLPAAKLHHALKSHLDPHNSFNPGRFVGGI